MGFLSDISSALSNTISAASSFSSSLSTTGVPYTEDDAYATSYPQRSGTYTNPAWVNQSLDTDALLENATGTNLNHNEYGMRLTFEVPDWSLQHYISERASFQKQIDSFTGEPGWFYFKVFFKFNTNYGLLGGIMTDSESPSTNTYSSVNTAIQFLANNSSRFLLERIHDRIVALGKFVCSLSYISCNAPWFFKGISGLESAYNVVRSDFGKDRSIELELSHDAVDMRITTLFDLYKFACYDNVLMKEIIPENLRKFDMSIVLYHTPLRYYQTGTMFQTGTAEYKHLHDSSNWTNRLSFKMFTFHQCEFDMDSLGGGVMTGTMNNEKAFELGGGKVKINYKKVYQHTSNEWNETMFGDNGFYWSQNEMKIPYTSLVYNGTAGTVNKEASPMTQLRMKAMASARGSTYYEPGTQLYKWMVDASEMYVGDYMRAVDNDTAFGNLYEGMTDQAERLKAKIRSLKKGTEDRTVGVARRKDTIPSKVHDLKDGTLDNVLSGGDTNMSDVSGSYFANKMKYLKDNSIDMIGSFTNLYNDVNKNDPNSEYFANKISDLKNDTVTGLGYEGINKSDTSGSYFKMKMRYLKDDSIDMIGVFRGLFNEENKSDVNGTYFADKIADLKADSVTGLGYGDEEYPDISAKVDELKEGTLGATNGGGNLYHGLTDVHGPYFKDKIRKLKGTSSNPVVKSIINTLDSSKTIE